MSEPKIPIINAMVFKQASPGNLKKEVQKLRIACQEHGFFYVQNHGIDKKLIDQLYSLSQKFFDLPFAAKKRISMDKGGLAWRGYFAVGEELTSGHPDKKEGLYFGSELDDNHNKVKLEIPMHGKNLFPDIPGFNSAVLDYMSALETLGQVLLKGLSLSLELEDNFFYKNYTHDPFVLFRIFNYPNMIDNDTHKWSVGEHTDYGLLTILMQDESGGLQIKSQGKWIDAPPIPNTFVCNIGDILDIITSGLYKSTPHRVYNTSGKNRLSMPFFMDPNFDAKIKLIDGIQKNQSYDDRWDRTNIYSYNGKYGDYVLNKVSKVFPQLNKS